MTTSGSQPIFRTRNNESHRKNRQCKFSADEDRIIFKMVNESNELGQAIHWSAIARKLTNKTGSDVSHRWNTVLDPDLKKGSWTSDEDLIVINWVKQHGPAKWCLLHKTYLPQRSGKQIRERWVNILSPFVQIHGIEKVENILNKENINHESDYSQNLVKTKYHIKQESDDKIKINEDLIYSSQPVNYSKWTKEEDDLISELFFSIGPKWKKIASMLNGRSENSVKNRWNSIKIQKCRILEGKDPIMKRGPKKKRSIESIDRPLSMMMENENTFSEIRPSLFTEIKDNELNLNFLEDLNACNEESVNNNKNLFLFSPTPINLSPSYKDFEISLENDPISPLFKI